MRIERAKRGDLKEILELQYLAYQSEAALYDDFSIPPLKQTLEEIGREFDSGVFLKAIDDKGAIIGAVRGFIRDGTLSVERLIVHPDAQGQGIGSKLVCEIEAQCPAERCELFTGDKSVGNIRLYERLGYVKYKEQEAKPGLTFVYMEKRGK
jgi:ribosomal protein S18 acetylase RimI-like enzyme